MEWLAISIIASVVLTVVLNVVIRLWPGGAERTARRLDDWVADQPAYDERSGMRVVFPWKAMLVASIVLTLALNLALIVLL